MVENTSNDGAKSKQRRHADTFDSFNDGEVTINNKKQEEEQQQRQNVTRKMGGRAKRQSGDLSTNKEQSSRSFSPELNAAKATPSSNSSRVEINCPKDALQQQYQQLLQQHEELSGEKTAVLDHVSTCHDKLNVSNSGLLNQNVW